jgi:NitT/TauT family transport system permease protein
VTGAAAGVKGRELTRGYILLRGILQFVITTVVAVAILGGAWWFVARMDWVATFILPTPGSVWDAAQASWHDAFSELRVTVQEVLGAVIVSWLAGILIGVALGTVSAFAPVLTVLRSAYALPFIVLYPLMTIWFGLGVQSKVIFGALGGAIPMALIVASGVKTIDPSVSVLFRSLDCSPVLTIRKGTLPALGGQILSGMRLSGSLALVYVVVAEMLASTKGIGFFIAGAAANFNTPRVYFGIVLVIILAIGLNVLLTLMERLIVPSNSVQP